METPVSTLSEIVGRSDGRSISRPLVFAAETSCDDTACAVVDGEGRVLSSVVSSQEAVHLPYGGVVPEIASREHLRQWRWISEQALARAGVDWGDLDAVAATRGPGLVGSLLVGLSATKAIAYGLGCPFLAMHHVEGHLFSPFLRGQGETPLAIPEAFLGLVVSGGHTSLYDVDHDSIVPVAETRDDAFGEAFDKIGKRLGLPFPGGPLVDALAERSATPPAGSAGNPFSLPRCGDGSLDFSYSGLKTRMLTLVEQLERRGVDVVLKQSGGDPEVLALLAAFRATAVRQILDRLDRWREQRGLSVLAVSGGAAANRELRRVLVPWSARRGVELHLVPLPFASDNAAMIAFAALLRLRRGERDDPRSVDALSRWRLQRNAVASSDGL